jgi:post-segregation antitoxin (ccd killing protein)
MLSSKSVTLMTTAALMEVAITAELRILREHAHKKRNSEAAAALAQ